MNQSERENIIKDIINHEIELVEVGSGDEYTKDISEEQERLSQKSDEELLNIWESNVGEWIASMRRWDDDDFATENGVPVWEAQGKNVIDWQLEQLLESGETEYGYMYPAFEQPY